jgi:hypothetical protein
VEAHAWLEVDGRPLEITDDYQVFTHPPGGAVE